MTSSHQFRSSNTSDRSDPNAEMTNQSSSFASYSTSSYSSSSTDPSGTSHSQRYTEQSQSNDRDGTTTRRRMEETGKPTLEDTTTTPAGVVGRRVEERSAQQEQRRVEDMVRQGQGQDERDRQYEEATEEEYAKREGGA